MPRIITKHNRDEPTAPRNPKMGLATNTEPLKTKTAQPSAGTAPFSAI